MDFFLRMTIYFKMSSFENEQFETSNFETSHYQNNKFEKKTWKKLAILGLAARKVKTHGFFPILKKPGRAQHLVIFENKNHFENPKFKKTKNLQNEHFQNLHFSK